LTQAIENVWRPLVSRLIPGLAAAIFCVGAAQAQSPAFAEKLQLCGACHGADGNSQIPNIPSLAGQPAFFILNQLFLMREGVRKVEAMAAIVKDLKDEDLNALSEHYSKLPPKASAEPIDPAQVKRGTEIAAAKLCASCHLPTLAGQEQVPRVSKQRVDYLIHAMKAYRDGNRPGADTLMSGIVAGMSDADLTALAHYAASH
jgi:cytochrome c553